MIVKNRDTLDPTTLDEFDHLQADLNVRLSNEHDEEGRHLPYESYTPTWSAGDTAPLLGMGTLRGRWARRGTEILFRLELTWGDDTTGGTGAWGFTLPVRPKDPENAFVVTMEDVSADLVYAGTARNPRLGNNAQGRLVRVNYVTGAKVTAAVPFAWASGDVLVMQGVYEGVA